MQSWTTRARQRGGFTQSEFLHEMRRAGFRVLAATLPLAPMFRFTHWLKPGVSFAVKEREGYGHALTRMTNELHTTTD
jgi:hypothetical protein